MLRVLQISYWFPTRTCVLSRTFWLHFQQLLLKRSLKDAGCGCRSRTQLMFWTILPNFAMVQIHSFLFSNSRALEMGMIWPERARLVQCFAHLISSVPNHFSEVQFTHGSYSMPVVEKSTHCWCGTDTESQLPACVCINTYIGVVIPL